RAREHRAHAAVGHDRRPVCQPLEEPGHRAPVYGDRDRERRRRQRHSPVSEASGAAPAASGPLNGRTLSIASGSDLTYPPARVDRRYFTAQAALACCRYLQRAPRRGLTAIILRPEIGAAPKGAALLFSRVN